jgi:hypothetical protein
MKDVAAELRARAEKARAHPDGTDVLNRRLWNAYADGIDEAASLVEALRSPARHDLAERVEAAARKFATNRLPRTRAEYRQVVADLYDAAEALRASAPPLCEPASTGVREDDEARVEMLEERIHRAFEILNDPEVPHDLARVMSCDKLRPLLRPAPTTLKEEDE